MKRFAHSIALTLLAVLVITACTHRQPSEAMTAARAMYERYADSVDGLTVAFVGDYRATDSTTCNAVMFQAADDSLWQWLQHEFGVNDLHQLLPWSAADENIIVSSMFIVPDSAEYVQLMTSPCDSNADLMQALGELLQIEMDSEKLHILMSDPADLPDQMIMQTAVGEFALQHQEQGFLVSVDQAEHVLWLFFYSDDAEEQALVRILEGGS